MATKVPRVTVQRQVSGERTVPEEVRRAAYTHLSLTVLKRDDLSAGGVG